MHIAYKIYVNYLLSVRLPVTSRLLTVKFGGELKVVHGFSTVQEVSAPNPHVVLESTVF